MKKTRGGDNGFGITGVVLGVIGLLLVIIMPIAGIAVNVIGLVFSVMQKKKSKNSWSKAGMILNIIGIALNILIVILAFVALSYIQNNPELLARLEQLQ